MNQNIIGTIRKSKKKKKKKTAMRGGIHPLLPVQVSLLAGWQSPCPSMETRQMNVGRPMPAPCRVTPCVTWANLCTWLLQRSQSSFGLAWSKGLLEEQWGASVGSPTGKGSPCCHLCPTFLDCCGICSLFPTFVVYTRDQH